MRAVIVGAGIGGLTAGLCLQRAGWSVRILEQAEQLTEVGAGIQISPNATRVLSRLGVSDALQATAVLPRALEMRTGIGGHRIFEVELEQSPESLYLHSHRADLIAVLQNKLLDHDSDALNLSKTVESYRDGFDKICIVTKDQERFDADLLVGAGGLHCPIRRQMYGKELPIDTGHCAWRAVIPSAEIKLAALPDSACVWTGAGQHAVSYRIRNGSLVNLVAVVESRSGSAESWSQLGNRSEALRDFEAWQPIVVDLIRKAPRLHKWALFERSPLPAWHQGRAVLLGDACHPMLPFMAQGAAMAIEDAWQLAHSLKTHTELESALSHYFEKRIRRTRRVQSLARKRSRTFHRQNLFSQSISYAPMWLAGQLSPASIKQHLAWLYEFDITR